MEQTGAVVDEVVATLHGDGHEPAVVAVIGLPRTLPDLAKILTAHPLLHAVEASSTGPLWSTPSLIVACPSTWPIRRPCRARARSRSGWTRPPSSA